MGFLIIWLVWVIVGCLWYVGKEGEYFQACCLIDKRIEKFERKLARESRREYRKARGIKSPGERLAESIGKGEKKIKIGGIEICQ